MAWQPPAGGEGAPGYESAELGRGSVQAPALAAGPPPAYPPQRAPSTQPVDTGGGLAVGGLIVGIIALVLPVLGVGIVLGRAPRLAELLVLTSVPIGIIGVVLSALGLGSRLRQRSAIAGLILAILGLLFGLALIVLAVVVLHSLRLHGIVPVRRPRP
jgi:hypothetical protein